MRQPTIEMSESIAQEIERVLHYEVLEPEYREWLMKTLEYLSVLEDFELEAIAEELGILG